MTDLFSDNMSKNKNYQKKHHEKILKTLEVFMTDEIIEWRNLEDGYPTHKILDTRNGIDILASCRKHTYFVSMRVQPDVSFSTFTIRVKTGYGSNNTEYLKLYEGDTKAEIFMHCYRDQILITKKEHIIEALKNGKGYTQTNSQDGALFRVLSIKDIGSSNVYQNTFKQNPLMLYGVI